jgi:hypothetical protein
MSSFGMVDGRRSEISMNNPDFVDPVIPIYGSAKTSPHNQVALTGLNATFLRAEKLPTAGTIPGEPLVKIIPQLWTEEKKNMVERCEVLMLFQTGRFNQ